MREPYWRARCFVIDKKLTQGYDMYAIGDTEQEAISHLKEKCKGMYHAGINNIDTSQRNT